jgi:CRISPR type I-D-associated protein Csc2
MSVLYQNIQSHLRQILGKDYDDFFHGSYETPRDFRISLVTLLETRDYAIFQSEPHRLDKVTLSRGVEHSDTTIERVECHESKPKQEIRRVGKRLMRKLLGRVEVTEQDEQGNEATKVVNQITRSTDSTDNAEYECHIPDCLCGRCRDCRLWGFAASGGDETGQPSRVDVGTAYTIRGMGDMIDRERVWNAVDEKDRQVRRAFGDKEQLVPEVYLPYVIDLRDVNLDEFLYLLYSVCNAGRIGAGRTKYGSIHFEPLALFFTYEQLFCNLRLTQHTYDHLYGSRQEEMKERAQRMGWLGEITEAQARKAVLGGVKKEAKQAACWSRRVPDDGLTKLLTEAKQLFRDREAMRRIVDITTATP